MGVRPPDRSGVRGAVEFGIAALAPLLEEADVEFPAESDDVVQALDDPDVPVDAKGRSIALSTALDETGHRRFESERELLNAVHPVLESHREAVSTGWLGSIRSQLPF